MGPRCMRQGDTVNQYNLAFLHYLFLVLLVFLVHSCSVCLCCFEEKIIRVNLTRQGFVKFHVSYQVFMRTTMDKHCTLWALGNGGLRRLARRDVAVGTHAHLTVCTRVRNLSHHRLM
jgi:hypothetical protein